MTESVYTHPGGTQYSSVDTTTIAAVGGSVFIVVPDGKRRKIFTLMTDTTMSATVGNRNIIIMVKDRNGNNQWIGLASANVAAAQVCAYDVGFGGSNNTPSTSVRRNLTNTAAVNVAVAELGDMPPEVIAWRRIQFRDAVQMAALTW